VTGDKSIKPWREVIAPHPDVREGAFQQAEFAADLWQVHLGKGSDEYQSPAEFFRRTYLTDSLKTLLTRSVKRLTGKEGDPIVQLQTNFGGGKTRSMLALYHLFSGTPLKDLAGIEELSQEAGFDKLPEVKRVVLVGTKISPGNPSIKDDGTEVRTLWGELAWQLGGKKAFARIAEDDKKATSPGDALRELFDDFGPCMILIDEWVAYTRQLHDENDLPGGSSETQFSFAQALTESARAAKQCLLVVSLPASDTAFSGYEGADDAEVGGVRGREALDRLRNVVGRMESSWRPATAEESFEIVRRRLFEPLVWDASYKERDLTARAFSELYQSQSNEFPSECSKLDYEKRIKAAYPIHPEVFDQLYGGWSTLVKFQRTRGVLRLMATVIHNLWSANDQASLIMPCSIPIDNTNVRYELTRYLDDTWQPVMETDVDGPNSLPRKIDNEKSNLGKISATRRVARTIYLGSAPTVGLGHQGITDQRIKLGCVLPGENSSIFGDALRDLSQQATYLYRDGTRYWYATQPTVAKMARDRAQQLAAKKREVHDEIIKRLRVALMDKGNFRAVYLAPLSGEDVPDEMETRLVVLAPEFVFSKGTESPTEQAAKAILKSRGNVPRLFQNTLVFMAADRTRLNDLESAICEHEAWQSIVEEKDNLDLTQQQLKQAEEQLGRANHSLLARLPECNKWLLVPTQASAKDPVKWESHSVSGSDALAVLAFKRLSGMELLTNTLGGTVLRKHMDEVPLWQGNHVAIRQLVDYFARYNYLPRITDSDVLMDAITSGLNLITWESESFAYAEAFDEKNQRYAGLNCRSSLDFSPDDPGLLVKPEVASR
jgi:predicted AAA+ superfamily ATPase